MQHLPLWCTLHLQEDAVTMYINAVFSACFVFPPHPFPGGCFSIVYRARRYGRTRMRNHDASCCYVLAHVHSYMHACKRHAQPATLHSTHRTSWPFDIVVPCCIAACVTMYLASFSFYLLQSGVAIYHVTSVATSTRCCTQLAGALGTSSS